MSVEIQITPRARKYGYVIWPSARRDEIQRLIGSAESVAVTLDQQEIGTRRVDWRYNRISLGPTKTKAIPESATQFVLDSDSDGELRIASR